MRRPTGAVLALLAACVVAAGCTTSVTVGPRPSPSAGGSSTGGTAPTAAGHVGVLSAVLRNMTADYGQEAAQAPGPADILDYDVGDLWLRGIDGTGTTIALVEGWDDPRLSTVISAFDQRYGLPAPDIRTIYPTGGGRLPARCPPGMVALGSYGSCDAWAGEVELDVETAHLIAPYADILVVVAPADSEITDDAASQVAPPEMMEGLEYVSAHHLADAVSISDGTGESTYRYGRAEITAQDPGELAAAAADIPVTVGTGDCGAVQNLAVADSQCGATTAGPSTAAWDDSPWVTAVGGSVPDLSPTGARLGPDVVWQHSRFAEGAGVSAVYARPAYQDGVVAGGMRQVPDITMDARSGTSESTPLFAAVLALAAQLNGGPVGPVDDALYRVLGPRGARDGITDIVAGSNVTPGNPGFAAHAGFDEATGWGTIDAAAFVPALVAAVRAQQVSNSPRARAAAALAGLEHGASLTPSDELTAGGFLPAHPVTVAVDGHPLTTLTADAAGRVSSRLSPAEAGLRPGRHTLTLHGMLLTEQLSFDRD